MRSDVTELEKNGFHIVDRTVPGWDLNPANLAKLSELIATAEPHDVVITDLLGNVTHRYAQVDGTLTMPFKSDGKYHYEGVANLKSLITL